LYKPQNELKKNNTVKRKVPLEQAMKAQMGRRGTPLLFL